MTALQLVVGLGNPGPGYARNRHNIGFMAADALAGRHGFPAFRSRFQGLAAEGMIAGTRVMLLKPMTYMNESGRSVAQAVRFFRLGVEAVTVLHDELDLAAGKLRVKRGGGHAGHNGIRNIAAHIGADFRRVRLGVGHPGDKDRVIGHVLKDFAKADEAWLEPLLEAVAGNFGVLIAGDDAGFMSRVALAVAPAKPARPAGSDSPAPSGGGEGP